MALSNTVAFVSCLVNPHAVAASIEMTSTALDAEKTASNDGRPSATAAKGTAIRMTVIVRDSAGNLLPVQTLISYAGLRWIVQKQARFYV